MATYWVNSCSFGLQYVSWYKYLIVSLVFSHLGFWSGNLFLIAPFPDLCLLVPFYCFQRSKPLYFIFSICILGLNQSMSTIHEQSNLDIEGFTTDIVGAAIALFRVWHTYKLDLEQLFRYEI